MYKPTLALGLWATAVAANSYTTTLLILGSGEEPILGSVITSDATATTYSLTCPLSGTPTDGCGFPTSFSFTQGPSTMHFQLPMYDSAWNPETIDIQCQITGSGGPCTQAIISSGTTSVQTITSYGNFASDAGAQAVTITDGPLPAASGATGTIPSTSATPATNSAAGETGSGNSSTGLSSAASSSPTTAGSSANSSTPNASSSSSSTKVSTGGVPMITGRPQWVIGGAAAAAVAIAAM